MMTQQQMDADTANRCLIGGTMTTEQIQERRKRLEHNRATRERNAAIREICGTSAACARRDGSV